MSLPSIARTRLEQAVADDRATASELRAAIRDFLEATAVRTWPRCPRCNHGRSGWGKALRGGRWVRQTYRVCTNCGARFTPPGDAR